MIATATEFSLLGLLLIGIAVMLTRAVDKIANSTVLAAACGWPQR